MKKNNLNIQLFMCLFWILGRTASGRGEEVIDITRINTARMPYRFEIRRSFDPINGISICDLDGDGTDEIIETVSRPPSGKDPYALQVLGIASNAVLFRHNADNPLFVSWFLTDIDADGQKELFAQEVKPRSCRFIVLSRLGDRLLDMEAARAPAGAGPSWECYAWAEAAMDVNGDGYRDLLINVQTTYGYQPRAIRCLDIRNRKWLWEYRMGTVSTPIRLLDVDEDGRREILFGSSSPCNAPDGPGGVVNGTDDRHTYLTVLDSLGRLLRIQPVGGEFESLTVFPGELDGNGADEMVLVSHSHKQPQKPGWIGLWNPATGVIGPRVVMEKRPSDNVAFVDVNRDGLNEILVGWDDGTIEIRDGHLDRIFGTRLAGLWIRMLAVTDLDSNGDEELLVSGLIDEHSHVFALDRMLRPIARFDRGGNLPGSEQESVLSPGFGQRKQLLLLGDARQASHLVSFEKQVLATVTVPWGWLAAGILAGGLLVWGLTRLRSGRAGERWGLMCKWIDAIPTGLLLLDDKGRLVVLNRSMRRLLDGKRPMTTGVGYETVLSQTDYESLTGIIRSSYQGAGDYIEKETHVLNRHGDYLDILVSVSAVPRETNGGASGRLILVQNITEISESKRTAVWAGIAQRLAHEIKTPLSSVMLSTQRIQMECEKHPDESRRYDKYLGHILGQVERLRKMTDAFLKFARIEKPKMEPCSINEIIGECLADATPRMGPDIRTQTHLEATIPAIPMDRQQIGVAVGNLIDNALSAMEGKGLLTITTRLAQSLQNNTHKIRDFLQIEIADTGRGIPKKYQPQLFQSFFSRSPSGTGLGLVIVKKIVEDHRGRIRIESEEGIGTTVFISLPVSGRRS
ncbi:GHKL domain-containing protein [bacterium]|nr:GHKL domain-containing protein [bacterium]